MRELTISPQLNLIAILPSASSQHNERKFKMVKKIKRIVKAMLGERISKSAFISNLNDKFSFYFDKKQMHLDSIFQCDFYQNNQDIIDYSQFNKMAIDKIAMIDSEFSMMFDTIKDGDIAIDIGANVGFYTLGLSTLVGDTGKVYSFEPGPVSFALLSRNVFANKATLSNNIVLENLGVSDRDSESYLFINPNGESDNQVHHDVSSYKFRNEPSRDKVSIRLVSLDSYFSNVSTSDIKYIKIDTQGHEYYVLKGAQRILTESNDTVVTVEYAPYLKAWENFTQDDFYSLIKSMGFRIYDMTNKNQEVDNEYLKKNYSANYYGKWTSLILKK